MTSKPLEWEETVVTESFQMDDGKYVTRVFHPHGKQLRHIVSIRRLTVDEMVAQRDDAAQEWNRQQ